MSDFYGKGYEALLKRHQQYEAMRARAEAAAEPPVASPFLTYIDEHQMGCRMIGGSDDLRFVRDAGGQGMAKRMHYPQRTLDYIIPVEAFDAWLQVRGECPLEVSQIALQAGLLVPGRAGAPTHVLPYPAGARAPIPCYVVKPPAPLT